MERVAINTLESHTGKEVSISGWIHIRRDQGKLIFLDIRDESGFIQAVILPKADATTQQTAKTLRSEYVVSVRGIVNERPEQNKNPEKQNGNVELEIRHIDILNTAQTPPFDITQDTRDIDESVRAKYRYLDLRTKRLQKNIRTRSAFVNMCRTFLTEKGFVEIETPLLTESTPEGSRDFVVPSRHNPGSFYALPQSPQQYKQLLINAGFEKYVQIARAVRDEDLRADRGYEHTQIDIEMSFITQNDIMQLVEEMIITTVEKLGHTIKEKPFPKITYQEAMKTYGKDTFDIRTDEEKEKGILSYAWVIDFPFFEKKEDGGWTFTHNPFSMPKEEYIDDLLNKKNIENILTTQYDLVCNGFETGGGSIRSHRADILEAVYAIMGNTKEETMEKVGHMIEAFSYGTPPHGGIALGVERNIMNLVDEEYLREVQAFPMTRKGQTSVMRAPKPLTEEHSKNFNSQ